MLWQLPAQPPTTPTDCSGVPWELKARDYAAETLTAALQSGYGSGVASQRFQGAVRSAMQAQARGSMDGKARLTKSARDMIAVSAMEGIGVGGEGGMVLPWVWGHGQPSAGLLSCVHMGLCSPDFRDDVPKAA